MNNPTMAGTRPVWGCLDAQEIRTAAAERGRDPNIQAHLSRCADCRRAVQDLSRELGHGQRGRASRAFATPDGRSTLTRPGFWLALIVIALAGYATREILTRMPARSRSLPAAAEPVAAPAEPPPAPPPARPRRASGSKHAPAIHADIVGTIRRNQAGVKACYERALKRDHNLVSRLQVDVRVRPTGSVEQVSIAGPVATTDLGSCIRNNIKAWQFPPAGEAYASQFPLILVPRDEAQLR